MQTVAIGKRDSVSIEKHPIGALLSWRSESAALDGYEIQALIEALQATQKED